MKDSLIAVLTLLFCANAYGGQAQVIFNQATKGTNEIIFEGVVESQRVPLLTIQDDRTVRNVLSGIQIIDPDEGLGEIDEDTIFLSCFCVPDNFITFKKDDGSFVALGTKHDLKEVEFLPGSETPNLPRLRISKKTTKILSRIIKKAKKT